ncbi:hypothetical protein GFY24_37260 [Nocardia sp. SYP-A9097]|uniref:hypothetical protein n=1 Tax=Nocardia sp. SYP-A9097 TaxID=2663237 RepID=UPI00129A9D47|nr:hypothetical protein [Nocardia sp. SYP-A9097]MRH93006.1 hypothetical protein [Nocardia sp. SYP-A9097]
MTIATQTVLSLVVVLDKVEDRLVVWHVNVGRAIGLSRLSGAWVVGEDSAQEIAALTAGYDSVWCGRVAEGIAAAGVVDLDATFAAAQAEVDAADSLLTEYQAAQSNKAIRPEWPELVHPAEAGRAPGVVDEIVHDALVLARGIADLADRWSDFESLRVARHFLTNHGGPTVRPLPLVVR